ncbi:hypothetical protein LEP1GSC060_1834 [Leptospira weilii serovar Ranarum str. ICFT]|uniref:Uncharacterized protein n=1 Tax=Leptospira weilii serovar Ranarum str. ICFT TaxID=1218598 RepID=N1WCM0_9LEPT|nr:hypothetical protein LEP1GSC060_1834 [Leptospira weilii serovar Ranarum str. ICFT]
MLNFGAIRSRSSSETTASDRAFHFNSRRKTIPTQFNPAMILPNTSVKFGENFRYNRYRGDFLETRVPRTRPFVSR